ncbi:MAG: alpha-E domain-containing protein, partial [Peristeroidobacter soli]
LGATRLSQMLDLMLYDDVHPMALAFHRRSIDRDLEELARGLGGERERGIPEVPVLPRELADLLDAHGESGDAARAALADKLQELSALSAELSDRVSRRYFALIESDTQAIAT